MTRLIRILVPIAAIAMLGTPIAGQTATGTTVSIDDIGGSGDTLTISGSSSYVDQPFLGLGTDAAGDVEAPLALAGMDATGASAATSLNGSVRLRWSLASLPPGAGAAPGVIYGWNFCVESGDCYELDASRANGNPPSADPFAILWRCADESCDPAGQTAAQTGGIPIVFDADAGAVTATLPSLVNATAGTTITPVTLDPNGAAFTMAGTIGPWSGQYGTGDGVAPLATYRVARREVSLGVGEPGLDPASVAYTATVQPDAGGAWSASLDVSGAPEGFAVYARACFGENNCGYASTSPELVAPAFGPLSSPIRPGSQFGSSCTFNFVFHQEVYALPGDAVVPDVFIGTAAHCTSGVGQRVSVGGFGQVGTVVYDSDQAGSDVDFSLVRIDANLVAQTNPQMRGFEGPKGVATPSMLAIGDVVDVYGYGIGVGQLEQTRPRSGVLTEWNSDEYMADMPAVNGDSGAPLLHDESGYALGIISRYGIRVPPSTDQGPLVHWALREIAKAGFDDVELSTIG